MRRSATVDGARVIEHGRRAVCRARGSNGVREGEAVRVRERGERRGEFVQTRGRPARRGRDG